MVSNTRPAPSYDEKTKQEIVERVREASYRMRMAELQAQHNMQQLENQQFNMLKQQQFQMDARNWYGYTTISNNGWQVNISNQQRQQPYKPPNHDERNTGSLIVQEPPKPKEVDPYEYLADPTSEMYDPLMCLKNGVKYKEPKPENMTPREHAMWRIKTNSTGPR